MYPGTWYSGWNKLYSIVILYMTLWITKYVFVYCTSLGIILYLYHNFSHRSKFNFDHYCTCTTWNTKYEVLWSSNFGCTCWYFVWNRVFCHNFLHQSQDILEHYCICTSTIRFLQTVRKTKGNNYQNN
jgi:hypothetical protein